MSYISDFLASDGSEEAYRDYKMAAAREDAKERTYIDDFERDYYENEGNGDLEIEYSDDNY